MDPAIESAFHQMHQELGRTFGQEINVYRPPLGTTVDQTPTLVLSTDSLKVERTGSKLAQPNMYSMEYYAVFGDYELVTPGDILVPQRVTSTTPITTFLSKSPGEESMSFKTSRVCSITEGSNFTSIYTNVRFDFLPTGFVRGIFDEYLQGTGSLPSHQVILYRLPNIQQNMMDIDIPGLFLIDTTGDQDIRYRITFAEEIGPLSRLTLVLER